MYASLESHSELATRHGAAVELGDRVVVVALCSDRECQSARLSWAVTSQTSHILIQLRTECIPRVGPVRLGARAASSTMFALQIRSVPIAVFHREPRPDVV